ncbi:6-carboxytetrahydropterin synthase QueD [Candidatus Marinamargulisbacteria bacterium SCGC AAA071-K20]|nr:6-carboxytetrahydropterin synthase QueD [Candidatus Marinamargulisbacteria bacterium SCGC AAA071-K20]
MYEVMVERHFAAAHFLENYVGPCANMHGHNYRIQLFVQGDSLNKDNGILVDFKDLKAHLDKFIDTIDHKVLNEVLDIHTTAECLAKYFFDIMTPHIPTHTKLTKTTLWESDTCSASYIP